MVILALNQSGRPENFYEGQFGSPSPFSASHLYQEVAQYRETSTLNTNVDMGPKAQLECAQIGTGGELVVGKK